MTSIDLAIYNHIAMSSEDNFIKATQAAFKLPAQSNENLLKLYALYKQATEGDVKGERPGMLNLKGRAKYDAWASLKGLDSQLAKAQYVELVRKLGGVF